MSARFAWFLVLLPATGCASGGGYTIVEKRVRPSHFRFVPIVESQEPGPGGWQAACLDLRLAHDNGRAHLCKVGVEMPMETEELGPIPVSRAQRLAAKCANEAADLALGATTRATPLGMACTSFIGAFRIRLDFTVAGSRVSSRCKPEAESIAQP
ncbi:MAG TPA: hypothetical protein VE153_04160 [Myxococcus sp.]|jgi:hypothetical protein|nr:hypothetical protein [Myxococcus sp.]